MLKIAAVAAIAVAISIVSGVKPALRGAHLVAIPDETYRVDCGTRVPAVSFGQEVSGPTGPGAGMDPQDVKVGSGQPMLQDGYSMMDCFKDSMYYHGDAHGDNRHDYKLGDVTHVSIVHYDAHVAKEDREPMTHATCFKFCRTVPGMNFFGITNGRHCYCAPYVRAMAGDSSSCDAPCDGNTVTMCGGKTKSAIFSMHECLDTVQELQDSRGEANRVIAVLKNLRDGAVDTSDMMQLVAEALLEGLGQAGDVAASDLMQQAKAFAGEILHAGETFGDGNMEKLTNMMAATDGDNIAELQGATRDAIVASRALEKMLSQAMIRPGVGKSSQYFHAMYFVDKHFENDTSTCGGKLAAKPLVAMDEGDCAEACDKDVHDCIGYSFFAAGPPGLCFLFANVVTLTHYTACPTEGSVCALKLSKFHGTTIAPDGSGKCDRCLTKLTKADRCYFDF